MTMVKLHCLTQFKKKTVTPGIFLCHRGFKNIVNSLDTNTRLMPTICVSITALNHAGHESSAPGDRLNNHAIHAVKTFILVYVMLIRDIFIFILVISIYQYLKFLNIGT